MRSKMVLSQAVGVVFWLRTWVLEPDSVGSAPTCLTILGNIIGLQRCPHSNSCDCLKRHGKGEFRLQMELRLLNSWPWGVETALDCPAGSSVIASVLKSRRGKQEVRVRDRNVAMETGSMEILCCWFWRWKKEAMSQRRWLLEGKRMDALSEPPERNIACRDLHFSPVRPESDLWPIEP